MVSWMCKWGAAEPRGANGEARGRCHCIEHLRHEFGEHDEARTVIDGPVIDSSVETACRPLSVPAHDGQSDREAEGLRPGPDHREDHDEARRPVGQRQL